MAEELTEQERARMQQLMTLQKVVFGIILRWWPLFVCVMLICAFSAASYLWWRGSQSVKRYEAQTRLLYSPKKIERVDAPSDKQLMSILERKSLKRRVAEHVAMTLDERMCLSVDMEIIQERRPTNLYTLKAASKTHMGAVDKVNAYAEILIDEYVEYRGKDLESWKASLDARRASFVEKLAAIESEEAELKARTGVLSPQEALVALNSLISDQRRNDSALGVELANEELKKKKLEVLVGANGKAVSENAMAIRRRVEAIESVDKELVGLRELYTDINPKVAGKLDEKRNLVREMEEFLKSKGAVGLDIDKIDLIEKSAGELAECVTRLEAIGEKRHALKQEIRDNEKRAATYGKLMPDYEKLEVRKADAMQSMRDLDDQLGGIAYAVESLRNDLRQIERAGGSGDRGSFTPRHAVLTVGGAVFLTGFIMFVILVLELFFGKVRGGREVAAYTSLQFIGALPRPGVLPEDEEREVVGVVSLKTLIASKDKKTVLVCRLPGSDPGPAFMETFDFTATMSGTSAFIIDIVSQDKFAPPEDAEQMIGVAKKGAQGWFPVANRYAIAPTELQMLQADIEALRDGFDLVFLRMEGGVRIGGSFFDQLLGLCGAVLLEVGAGKTPRSVFAYARRHLQASGKPVLAISTLESARRVRIEMEEKT